MINIKDFDSNLLKIDKKSYTNIGIDYIGYITIKNISDYENIYSINPLYVIIGEIDGYIKEENENKYLTFASADKNKEVLKKYTELCDGIKNSVEKRNDSKAGEYGKDFIKIKFNSDNNLPLNEILNLHMLAVIVRSVFEDDGKHYPQVFLDECLYQV